MNMDAFDLNALDFMALHWLRAPWLWALLALPLLAWWWRVRHRQRSVWGEAVDAHLLPHLLDDHADSRWRGALILALLAAALAICALAGPSWQREMQPLWQTHAPLVIALDLSSASLAGDLPPSRLLQARAKIATLLRTRAGGQVGLVAFADDAFTVAPLTDDAANVALFLDALEPDVMPVDGSRADRAIAQSAKLLQQARLDRGDILLATDHADASARSAAAAAAQQGYRVSVLGLGTPDGAAYREPDGRIAHARLDVSSLRALAASGGGSYAVLTAGNGDLATLAMLNPQHAGAASAQGHKTSVWRDQGYWLLPPLMLLALFAFRRGNGLAVLLLFAWLPWQPARAATHDWWRRPDQQAHARQEQGAAAYRKKNFAGAARQWGGLSGADAAYNRGNALAMQGDYDAAISAYDQALRVQRGMQDALANRKAVEAAKRRKPPAGKQQNKPGGQSGQQPSSRSGSGEQKHKQDNGANAQNQRPPQGQPQASATPPKGPLATSQPAQQPADPAGDAQAQRQADAAQRQRMQQALQKAKRSASAEKSAPPEPAQTQAQRERRLANDAWLRRVPDDPGGLLRAKFQLEYARRQGDR